jgi:hypothetical protein
VFECVYCQVNSRIVPVRSFVYTVIADSGDGLSVSIVMSNCSVEPPTDSEETTLNDAQSGEPP